MLVATKRKRVSKKNKSSWRKHTDIQDVEDFLEDQRQEERIGSFKEEEDKLLFEIDVVPDKKLLLSGKQKRKLNALKPAKSLSALVNASKVQDPITKRNHVKVKKPPRDLIAEVLDPKKQKHIQSNKDRQRYYDKLDKKVSSNKAARDFSSDMWEEKGVLDDHPEFKKEWISKELALYNLRNLGKPINKVHDSIRHKTTKAKKFVPPHPGTSYNPSLEDHQDLLKKVEAKEADIIKEEKHLKRVTTNMFSKITEEERDLDKLRELVSGLSAEYGNDEIEIGDENDDDVVYKSVNPPVTIKKKAKKARRKQKEQREITQKLQKKKAEKKKITDIHRLRKLKEEVEIEEEDLNKLKKHRKEVAYKKKFEPKRLSKLKFQEPDIEINMPEDIAGNLRNVKQESSLLVDRFKNFQKRNILPTSVDLGPRKRSKIKRFVRSSHKETPPQPIISKRKK